MDARPPMPTAARFIHVIVGIILAVLALPAPARATLYFHIDSAVNAPDANPGDGVCADATGKCNMQAAYAELQTTWTPACGGDREEWTFADDLPPMNIGPMPAYDLYGCGRNMGVHGHGRDRLTIQGVTAVARTTTQVDLDNLTIAGATVGVEVAAPFTGLHAGVSLTNVAVRDNQIGIRAGFLAVTSLDRTDVFDNSVIGIQSGSSNENAPLALGLTDSRVFDNGSGIECRNYLGLTMVRSAVSDNRGDGLRMLTPAVVDDDVNTLRLEDSTISHNDGIGLSIVVVGQSSIETSTISGNGGGGVFVQNLKSGDAGPPVRFENASVSGNTSDGNGGGVLVTSGSAELRASTVTGNTADADATGDGDGGGVYGKVRVTQSIVAGNTDGSGEAPDCGGTIDSGGHNLIGTTTGCPVTGDAATNLTNVDPLLGPLQDNGGPTPTHALLAGSPAIDAGGACALTSDQRGVTRPQFAACDVGAFERACGNGTVDLGETCDDAGTCCSADCEAAPAGTACSDGDACTTNDACDATAACVPGAPVACGACATCDVTGSCAAHILPACHQPTERFSGELAFTRGKTPKLAWAWTKGEATTVADFGNPLGGDTYALCVFDESVPTPAVAFAATTRSGQCGTHACWKRSGQTSLRYKDPHQTPDGLDALLLKAGADGKAKILLTGKGPSLAPPPLPVALPLRVQLQAANGQCWEASYHQVGTSRNDATGFKAKAFKP